MSDAICPPICHKVTLSKLLASLKRIFINPVGPETPIIDHILCMDDGFEFFLKEWSRIVLQFVLNDIPLPAECSMRLGEMIEGLSSLYDLCTGRYFSVTFETDPDLVKKLAEVSTHFEVLSGIVIECTLLHMQFTAFIVRLTLWLPAFRQVRVHEISSSRLFTSRCAVWSQPRLFRCI